ncbi:hypothetical protein OAD03_00865 [Candidatus Pelagibacter sp.]|nr:hypothetical protein [Candidatus Pelagibacter sp.]
MPFVQNITSHYTRGFVQKVYIHHMKTKEKTMKKTNVEIKEQTNVLTYIGMLLIGFAVVDFAMSWTGTNLTSFLGPVSQFSPMITGFVGFGLLNAGRVS